MSNANNAGAHSSAPALFEPGWHRIQQLDGVRGLAILMVLIWHCYVCTPTPDTFLNVHLKNLLCLTWSGVDLFFVLSGFLIGGILIDHKHDRNYYKVFYARRVCRIFPPYFLLVITYAILWRPRGSETGGDFPLWSYAFFLQSIFIVIRGALGNFWLGGTWSLAIEEQFYLLFPFLVRICRKSLLPHLFVILILVAPLCRMIAWSMSHPPGLVSFAILPCRMDALALGALGAWMVRQAGIRQWLDSHQSWLFTYLCLFGAGFGILSLRKWALLTPVMASFGHTWLGIFYLLIILVAVTSRDKPVIAIYKFAPLRLLGVFSYFIYLSHGIVIREVSLLICHHEPELYSPGDVLATMLGLITMMGLAAISWFVLEKPLLTLGRKLKYEPAEG